MGQRGRTLAQILGFDGFRVRHYFETARGVRIADVNHPSVLRGATLVLVATRRWLPCCGDCGRPSRRVHQRLPPRRWNDLGWAEHPVVIEYAPVRVHCGYCHSHPVEWIAWADRRQHQTRRLQQHLAVQTMSMSISHVAALHNLDWATVRRCQDAAIERWERTRPSVPLRQVGVDEKYLGRRNARSEKFITIVSNLTTGEPVWIGEGRREETLASWLGTLDKTQKSSIQLFAMDMFEAFRNAVRADPDLAHVSIVHDPFHVMISSKVAESPDACVPQSELSRPRRVDDRIFVGSEDGAAVNTTFTTLIASCHLQDIEPEAYLREVMCLLPDWPRSRLLELAPCN